MSRCVISTSRNVYEVISGLGWSCSTLYSGCCTAGSLPCSVRSYRCRGSCATDSASTLMQAYTADCCIAVKGLTSAPLFDRPNQ
jgi:hypothetical protein